MRPITAQPGYVEADVVAAMDSGQFVYSDCYTITPKVGLPLRYTASQQDVSVVPLDGMIRQTYRARKVLIKGLLVKTSVGIQVDEQQVQLDYSNDLVYQDYLSWPQALLSGRLDGSSIRRDRFIATAFGQPWLGGMPMFLGLVSSLTTVGRQSATINVKSDLVVLDVQMPQDLFEPNCQNTWGDTECGVDQSAFAVSATVGASPSRSIIPWAGATADFALGKIHYAAGDAVTRVRTISRVSGGNLYLSYPLDFDPVAGDTFIAFPNCRRQQANCVTYHGDPAWKTRFKGFPFVPVAETAIG